MRTWRRLIEALGADASQLGLRKGASETSLIAAETLMNVKLPADYRALLAITDGQDEDGLVIFEPDARLLPIARVMELWVSYLDFMIPELDEEPVDDDAAVRPVVWHRTRIPIAADYLDQGPFLDLWPGPAGTFGQLIQLVSEHEFELIAPSLDAYLVRRADEIAATRPR